MKAVAVFPGSQQVKIIEQDVPRLTQPDQVALRLQGPVRAHRRIRVSASPLR